jgi:hypothetical protein
MIAEDRGCPYRDGKPPILLNPDERLSVRIYWDAVALSGHDSNGLPLISNLALALEAAQLTLSIDEASLLIERIKSTHTQIRSFMAEKLSQKMSNV